MKIIKFVCAFIWITSGHAYGMEQSSWKASLWNVGQYISSGALRAAQAGAELFQGQKVGDFFTSKLPRDLHPMVWVSILKDHTLKEKVRRLAALRRVCTSWNGMLHEERILKVVVPVLFAEGSFGPLLASSKSTLARRSMLHHFITYGFVADRSRCEAIEQFLKGEAKKIMFLHGPNVIDITEWSKILAQAMDRKVISLDAAKMGPLLEGFCADEKYVDLFFEQKQCDTLFISDIDELCAMFEKPFRILLQKLSKRAHCIVSSNVLFNKIKMNATNYVTGASISIVHTTCPADWQRERFPEECVLLECGEPSVCERRIILQLLTEQFMATYLAPPEASSMLKMLARGVALLPIGDESRPYFASYLDLAQKMQEHSLRSVDANAFSAVRLDAIAQGTENFSYNDLRLIFANVGRFFERQDVAADGQPTHRITPAIVDRVVQEACAKKGTGFATIPID